MRRWVLVHLPPKRLHRAHLRLHNPCREQLDQHLRNLHLVGPIVEGEAAERVCRMRVRALAAAAKQLDERLDNVRLRHVHLDDRRL